MKIIKRLMNTLMKKIKWFASPGITKADFLNKFDLKYTKVPSALIVNTKFLEAIAKEKNTPL